MYFRFVAVDVDGKLSRVRIDAMRQVQVVVHELAPLKMVERWAALIAASLPILKERRVGSIVASDILSEIWIDFGSVSKLLMHRMHVFCTDRGWVRIVRRTRVRIISGSLCMIDRAFCRRFPAQ